MPKQRITQLWPIQRKDFINLSSAVMLCLPGFPGCAVSENCSH